MSRAEDQVIEAQELLSALIPHHPGGMAERLQAVIAALAEVQGHVFVRGALAVPFTAAVSRAATVASEAYCDGASSDLGALEAVESAVIKLQGKTTGTGGIAIT
jgi:hypothetical protein